MFSKFDLIGFISNVIAVIFGIIITFSIQSMIDKKKEKEEVKASLVLVKDELTNCYNDLNQCAELMELEVIGAKYILSHKDSLQYCSKDSIDNYGKAVLFMNILSLPNDALELLKSSSLFAKISDPSLSIQIIRAYDYCNVLQKVFEKHEINKTEMFGSNLSIELGKMLKDGHIVSLKELGMNKASWKIIEFISRNNESMAIRKELPQIKSTIDSIDEYLNK